ncbi:hypothetical protein ACHAO4_003672 [Trichoderma viride]
MWGLQSSLADGEWSFPQDAPQNLGTMNGIAEEISVCVAKQATYISNKATATPRKQGQTFADQWARAFEMHPKVIMLTWWNEWMAQRQANDGDGNPQFFDEYSSKYSRDIEPQDPTQPDGHGSKYLDWAREYISTYKANRPYLDQDETHQDGFLAKPIYGISFARAFPYSHLFFQIGIVIHVLAMTIIMAFMAAASRIRKANR